MPAVWLSQAIPNGSEIHPCFTRMPFTGLNPRRCARLPGNPRARLAAQSCIDWPSLWPTVMSCGLNWIGEHTTDDDSANFGIAGFPDGHPGAELHARCRYGLCGGAEPGTGPQGRRDLRPGDCARLHGPHLPCNPVRCRTARPITLCFST